MSAKTKIVVLHKKEVLYAGIFTFAGLMLVILFLFLFLPKQDSDALPGPGMASEMESPEPQTSSAPKAVASSKATTTSEGILQETLPEISYHPGIYKTELILGGQSLEVEVVLEKDRISSLRLVNLDEAISTMYPLLEPTMDKICEQVYETQSLDRLELDSGAKYTSLVLLEAIRCCLEKGADEAP